MKGLMRRIITQSYFMNKTNEFVFEEELTVRRLSKIGQNLIRLFRCHEGKVTVQIIILEYNANRWKTR